MFFLCTTRKHTFSGSVAENLRMVKEDATDEDIVEALKTACAYEFVSKLPGVSMECLESRGMVSQKDRHSAYQ